MIGDGESYKSYPKMREEDTRYQNGDNVTWFQIDRKYLLPETLIDFGLPWDYLETDPNYIVIKKSITDDILEELFAHTRRLKEGNKIQSYAEQSPWQDVNPFNPSGPFNPDQNLNYQPPKCVSLGVPLSFDIGLKSSTVKRSVDGFRADPSHRGHVGQRLDVVSSRMPGYGKVVLYRTDATVNEGQDPQFSWT
ncbi:hypothetical protein N7471_001255 [Penicillium samsonianum]|uniref:uncharacterized protein n=1 Tax=Penicillium samsonianum TaxID=1882272 RepID=UPI002548970F|nr:uncharacterized protein N7471_001255 [Penicillium samsonianum]KAJ6150056.1 hypothetical protein N7471_001255 [Penicillium samsonianum]